MSVYTVELAKGTNIPSEITPSRGPPSSPKMLSDICKTVEPAYSQRKERPMTMRPNKQLSNFDKCSDM